MTKEEFKNIYDQHFEAVRNYIYYRSGNTELATDIAQETFLKVWEKQFRAKEGKIKGLLYKIAGDKFISHIRHQKVVNENAQEIKFRYLASNKEEDSTEEIKQKYEKAITKLTDKQRTVLLMNKIDGYTYKEIASYLTLSVKSVEKRMSLALATLRKEMKTS